MIGYRIIAFGGKLVKSVPFAISSITKNIYCNAFKTKKINVGIQHGKSFIPKANVNNEYQSDNEDNIKYQMRPNRYQNHTISDSRSYSACQ